MSKDMFTVHRLWPEGGEAPLDYKPALTVIFFHGLQIRDGDKAWEATWRQRHREKGSPLVCWPRDWLPRDLGERKVVVYSLSYDADAIQWKNRGNTDDVQYIGKDLIQSLVASEQWGLEQTRSVALVGHSFGGLVLKSLVVEAKRRAMLPGDARKTDVTRKACESCEAFLEKLKCAVFYATPHSGSEAAALARNLQKLVRIPQLAGILQNLQPFESAMEDLSIEFKDAARADINIFAFIEGAPISFFCGLKSVMVVECASAMRLGADNYMRIEDANHYEVCKPPAQNHVSYTKLLELLRVVMLTADEDGLT